MRIRAKLPSVPDTALLFLLLLSACGAPDTAGDGVPAGVPDQRTTPVASVPADEAAARIAPKPTPATSPTPSPELAPTPAPSATLKPALDKPAIRQAAKNCLLLIWSERPPANARFDQDNDQVEGGSISCATGATPGEFNTVITAISAAAKAKNKARLLEEIGLPLLFIDENGKRQNLPDAKTIDAAFDQVFDDRTLALLSELDLSQMAVTQGQGGSFRLGSLWLAIRERDGGPKIVTINRQALGESDRASSK